MALPAGKPLPRYTSPVDGRLTGPMLADFRESGVLILENFVSRDRCEALRERALQLVDSFDPASAASVFSTTAEEQLDDRYFIESGDKIRFFLEAEAVDGSGALRRPVADSLNKMGHAMHDLDPVFDAFSRTPALATVARGLGLYDPVIIQSMYVFKPPHIGGEVVCHQDSTYLYTEPESCTGFWFALDDATMDNGCMQFIGGAHTGPLKKRNRRVAEFRLRTETLDPAPWPEEMRQPAEAPAGSLVVFTGRTPHMSEANRSSGSRHAYTLHAIDRQCRYPQDNWLQRRANLPLRGFGEADAVR